MALLLIVPHFLAIVKTILLSFWTAIIGKILECFFGSSVNSTNSAIFFLESFAKFLILQN
jgi:hypothetical protein